MSKSFKMWEKMMMMMVRMMIIIIIISVKVSQDFYVLMQFPQLI